MGVKAYVIVRPKGLGKGPLKLKEIEGTNSQFSMEGKNIITRDSPVVQVAGSVM